MAVLSGDRDHARDMMLRGIPFPCGQCLPCRINRRRVWTHRMMLESYMHSDSSFVTLTYSDEYLPQGGTLVKTHVQLFLKRLRKALEPSRIRYYAAGEYGGVSGRPHYHLIVFGLHFSQSHVIESSWPYGHVHVGYFSQDSATYVSGYVTKKTVRKNDLLGRLPEFSLMSRKPGIGYPALDDVCKLLDNPHFQDFLNIKGDVPDGLKHGKSFYSFGRFLRDKLRFMMEVNGDDSFIYEMRSKYIEASRSGKTLVDALIDESKQRNRQIEAQFKIFTKRSAI